jgi:polysaccharide pyruvyl transferase WcaK-like protein
MDMPAHLDRWTKAARNQGARVDVVSVGVSTVTSAESRRLFRGALNRATYLSVRDEDSLVHAASVGAGQHAQVTPDLAFSLPCESLPSVRSAGSPPVVGLGLMGYYGWNRSREEGLAIYGSYLQKMVRVVGVQLSRGRDVLLFTGDARADSRVCDDLIRECVRQGMDSGRVRNAYVGDYQAALAAIASSSVVVATRFHNVVFSLMLQRPVVSIGYDGKNDAVMAQFGLADYCHHIEGFDPQIVNEQVDAQLSASPYIMRAIPDMLAQARARLARQYDELCGLWRT